MRLVQSGLAVFLAVHLAGCSGAETTEAPSPTSEPSVSEAPAVKTQEPAAKPAPKPAATKPMESKPAPADPVAQEPAATQPEPAATEAPTAEPSPALTNPDLAREQAPDVFKARFVTTKGDVVIEVNRAWSPNGADRFYNLVKIGYFTDIAFFRAVKGFVVQFGMHGDPDINAHWGGDKVPDDPIKQSNLRGFLTFAEGGPGTRSNQLFINLSDANKRLDNYPGSGGFSPIGRVIEGMAVVDELYMGYGDMPAMGGRGPDPGRIGRDGNEYLKRSFPKLDYIKSARIE